MAGMIVVGVDSSTPSRAALDWSVRRAASTGSDVTLVHVVDDDSATNGARPVNGGHAGARRFLETEVEHAGSIEPTVVVQGELRAGSPMRELVAASAEADLVVVGTHKTGFVHGKVFGSRTLQLAAASRVPVAVIPESPIHGRSGIVAGIDESPASAAAVRFATEESERTGNPLYLLRAWGWHESLHEVDAEQHDENRRAESVAKALLKSTLALLEPEVDAHPRAVRRPAAEALVAAATSASMLVIGNSRREGEERLVLGSVAHDVLVNITGPTIIVHAGDPRPSASRHAEQGLPERSREEPA